MSAPTVSVVVVSYDRPDDLELCLKALKYQYRRNFEIVVVHNSGSEPGIRQSGIADEIKTVPFETPNISAARNLGIEASSGEIIAFIDDDAIAEPTWLKRLVEPFANSDVAAAGGFVVGRNGFGLQWAGELVNDYGEVTKLDVTDTTIVRPKPNAYAKTHGTNCSFRRSSLVDLDGFDENFHFYMDETDLNIRLGQAGCFVAIVPTAEVHHSYSKSMTRSQSRSPKSLFEIGASTSYFLKKHSLDKRHIETQKLQQTVRLKKLVIAGRLEPRDISILEKTFDDGVEEGKIRAARRRKLNIKESSLLKVFRPYSSPKISKFLSCRRLFSKDMIISAAKNAAKGDVVTLFVFSWTSLRHRRGFHPDGYWFQKGGMFGKSDRDQRIFQLETLKSRTQREISLLREKRDIATV